MLRRCFLFVLFATAAGCAENETAAIRRVLDEQTAAWNRGDLVKFVDSYAEDAVFVGTEITRGKAGVLARYQTKYDTSEKRGRLEFTDLEIQNLSGGYASVIGRFHLTRTAAAGGDARGIFSLLFRKKSGEGWKIVLDHTS